MSKYTPEQIEEALEHWQRVLQSVNESKYEVAISAYDKDHLLVPYTFEVMAKNEVEAGEVIRDEFLKRLRQNPNAKSTDSASDDVHYVRIAQNGVHSPDTEMQFDISLHQKTRKSSTFKMSPKDATKFIYDFDEDVKSKFERNFELVGQSRVVLNVKNFWEDHGHPVLRSKILHFKSMKEANEEAQRLKKIRKEFKAVGVNKDFKDNGVNEFVENGPVLLIDYSNAETDDWVRAKITPKSDKQTFVINGYTFRQFTMRIKLKVEDQTMFDETIDEYDDILLKKLIELYESYKQAEVIEQVRNEGDNGAKFAWCMLNRVQFAKGMRTYEDFYNTDGMHQPIEILKEKCQKLNAG